ncbi:DNA replication complex GINS protein PSF1 [Pichia californica]|uniref:DNA replication complex GINS protein PSF1 n=1 Tax=Pichia californica TaxID=460514 RepID=A0A9P7BGK4_9ASCO|nr:DNA replication complex GINS protein PSF1 [[Candida] californica]KAG0689315.1 DNA replication complex GINS protein PSF1 [[Candida] californica]
MYGDTGIKLVLAAKRANTLDRIPLYEGDLVQTVLSECNELHRLNEISDEDNILLTNQSQVSNITDSSAFGSASRNGSALNTPLRSSNGHFLSSSVNNTPGNLVNEGNSVEVEQTLNKLPEYVRGLFISQNKRCLMAYEMQRLRRLDQLVWDNIELSQEQLSDLSHHERTYLEKYISLVSGVKGVMSEIDLGGDLEPPSDVFIDVRVLKDAGEIMTEYGVFNLVKDSQFFVRRVDVERLIQQEYLKEL